VKYLKEDIKNRDASAKAQLQEEGKKPAVAKTEKAKPGTKDPLLDVDTPGSDEDLDDQLDAESQDEVKEDFEVLFARDYVLKAPFTDREKMLKAGKPFVEEKRRDEENRINGAIAALGIDWTPGVTPKNVQLLSVLRPGADKKILAGELIELEVVVENKGSEPVSRLRAWTDSDNPILDRREFLFGTLKPGEKRSWKTPIRLPKDMASRRDEVTVKFFDDNGPLTDTAVTELNVAELPRPAFAYNWQIIDNCTQCNGDGQVQRGEDVELLIDITNTGSGKALDAFAQIKNAAGENIFIEKGRFKVGELAIKETKTARFVLDVKKAYKDPTFALKLAIIDEPLEEFTTEKMQIPVNDSTTPVEPKKGAVKVSEKATLFNTPGPDARPLATLPKGALLQATGELGGFVKVETDKNRFAFVKSAETKDQKAKALPLKDVAYVPFRAPPQIALNADPGQGGLIVDGDKFTITGVVSDPNALLDMYVLLNDQKVFFKSAGPADATGVRIPFSAELTLKEGNNNVLVVARETPEFGSRKGLVIRRRPAAVAQKLAKPAPTVTP
jgi:carboxyl-terminal processing protease